MRTLVGKSSVETRSHWTGTSIDSGELTHRRANNIAPTDGLRAPWTCCAIVGDDVKHKQTLGVGVAAGLRKEDAKLREALNNALGEIMSDGTYKKDQQQVLSVPAEVAGKDQ